MSHPPPTSCSAYSAFSCAPQVLGVGRTMSRAQDHICCLAVRCIMGSRRAWTSRRRHAQQCCAERSMNIGAILASCSPGDDPIACCFRWRRDDLCLSLSIPLHAVGCVRRAWRAWSAPDSSLFRILACRLRR